MNTHNTPANIIVGLSGGVDSSVTAALLKQQGHQISGVFMQNWEDDDNDEYCSIKQDSFDAIAVADIIGIDIDIVNFAAQYKDNVFAYFLKEYSAGRTPNPDILCNAEIKFKCFLDYAIEQGADTIATGHYARKEVRNGVHYLLKGLDQNKDQSYFLYRLKPFQLSARFSHWVSWRSLKSAVLPKNSNYRLQPKKTVPASALSANARSASFCKNTCRPIMAKSVTPEGKVVGEHVGLMFYTLGQRKGLGIGGAGEPWFVAAKDLTKNELMSSKAMTILCFIRKAWL